MNTKRGAAKGVSLAKRKAQANAFDKLSENPTEAELKNAAANVALAELEERVADVRDSWETESLFEDAFEELTANSPNGSDGELPSLFISSITSNLASSLLLHSRTGLIYFLLFITAIRVDPRHFCISSLLSARVETHHAVVFGLSSQMWQPFANHRPF